MSKYLDIIISTFITKELMYNKLQILFFCLICMGLIYFNSVSAQDFTTIFKYLNDDQAKDVDEILQSIQKATELTKEANNLYYDVLMLESDSENAEGKKQANPSKIESQALKKQVEANKLFSESYGKLFKILRKSLEEKGSANEESQNYFIKAEEMMKVAIEKREEAKDIKEPYKKASIQNDASGFESIGVENIIFALKLVNGETVDTLKDLDLFYLTEEELSKAGYPNMDEEIQQSTYFSQIDGMVINQDLIRKYKEYINDRSVRDPLMVNRMGLSQYEGVGMEDARDYYLGYLYGSLKMPGYSDTLTPDSTINELYDNHSSNPLITSLNDERYGTSSNNGITIMESGTGTKYSESALPAIERGSSDSSAFSGSSVQQLVFLVQIAASRIPLSRSQIWAIYPGNYTIEEVHENGWYKYRITGIKDFSIAMRVADESGVPDAWILARYQNNYIKIYEAKELLQNPNLVGPYEVKLNYYIQVAASRMRLSTQTVTDLCISKDKCRVVFEGGWFKYQIYSGETFYDALKLSKSYHAENFIVVYREGTKMKLYKALENEY